MKIFVILLFYFSDAFCGNSFSFIIKFLPKRVQVTSPKEFSKELSVIVENKTLGRIWGKIVDMNNEVVHYLGIPSEGTRSAILKNLQKNQSYYFISESPPFQKITLEFNKDPYEIPPSK